ncbi:MAG: hypothetical protein DRO39_07890 [Thermoprotei archaeon]|nr:MAG: hypothetical protein DRO39_07890 [Thermoprotei archaeon]
MTPPIAWCNTHLAPHLVAVAYTASLLFEEEWRYRARLSKLPTWTLTLAALGHDVGKAAPWYQEEAVSRCSRGWNPSFTLHEVLSSMVIAWLGASGAVDREPAYVAAIAVWEHHHGMPGRLAPLLTSINAASKSRYAEALRAGFEALLHTLDFARSTALVRHLELPPIGERRRQVLIPCHSRKALEVVENNPRFSAAASSIAGFLAVADTLVASIERNPGKPVEALRGRYVYRYLKELMGGETPLSRLLKFVTSTVLAIHEEYRRWVDEQPR